MSSTLAHEFLRLQRAKQAIKEAIREKYVEIDDDLPLESYADKIRQINVSEKYRLNDNSKFRHHELTKLPNIDTGAIADASYLFSNTNLCGDIEIDLSAASLLNNCFSETKIRSIKLCLSERHPVNLRAIFYRCSLLEDVCFTSTVFANSLELVFYDCFKLRRVKGIIDLSGVSGTGFGAYTFNGCHLLEELYLKNAYIGGTVLGFGMNLKKECIEYLIDNLVDLSSPGKTLSIPGAVYRPRVSSECIDRATRRGYIISFY